MATNRHGVGAIDIQNVSGYGQLVVCLAHARGGTLDLLMADVPDLVRDAVVALVAVGGYYDNKGCSILVIQDLHGHGIWSADNAVLV